MKKRSFKAYHTNISFIDLLFNTVLGFAVFFIIAFVLMSIQKKQDEPQIRTKAEFVITLTWDDRNKDDVDLWIEDPNGQVMWYRDKEVGLMHLDRDDLGHINDIITLATGEQVVFPYNQEIGTIRGCMPGEWIVNVHMYAKRTAEATNIVIKIEKLNPTVKTIVLKNIIIAKDKEEFTVLRMQMSDIGTILSTSDIPKSLVNQKLINMMGGI